MTILVKNENGYSSGEYPDRACKIGDIVTITLNDENGMPSNMQQTGEVIEIANQPYEDNYDYEDDPDFGNDFYFDGEKE